MVCSSAPPSLLLEADLALLTLAGRSSERGSREKDADTRNHVHNNDLCNMIFETFSEIVFFIFFFSVTIRSGLVRIV